MPRERDLRDNTVNLAVIYAPDASHKELTVMRHVSSQAQCSLLFDSDICTLQQQKACFKSYCATHDVLHMCMASVACVAIAPVGVQIVFGGHVDRLP